MSTNVRLRGVTHDARARAGRTECGLRFVLYASMSKALTAAQAVETADPVDCMTCLVRAGT